MNGEHADRFTKLEELEHEHGELVDALDRACADETVASDSESERRFVQSNRERIGRFLAKGAATGAILHGLAERRPAQQILDRWAACLYRVGIRDVPAATLAPFDEAAAPDLRDKRCPYVGLQPFDETLAARFFGRDERTAALVEAVRTQPFVFVTGASGSGKSSLVLAGLIPSLKQPNGKIEGSDRWTFVPPIVPGTNPLESLARALCTAFAGLEPAPLLEQLRGDPTRLRALLDEQSPATCLIVVDQFEEVFTLRSSEAAGDSDAFIAALVDLALWPEVRHRVVATFRKDREGDLAASGPLQHLYFDSPFIVSSMLPEQLRDAIERPAAMIGLIVEPDVVDALVHTFTGDETGLPLLQYCLVELWERRSRNRVTRRTLAELGDPKHAMAKVADEVYNALLTQGQAAAKVIFLHLSRKVEGQEFLRVRQLRKVLWSAVGNKLTVDDVVARFAERRLLRVSPAADDAGDDTIEVAHEALLRNWTEFRKWVVEEGARLDQRMFISRQARLWAASEGRSTDAAAQDATGLLLSGIALRQAMTDLYDAYPEQSVERRFLDASSRKAQWVESELQRAADAARLEAAWANENARRKSRSIRMLGAGALAILIALLAFMTYKDALDERDRRAVLAQRLGSQALHDCETDALQSRRYARLAIEAAMQPAWRIPWPAVPGTAALSEAMAAAYCMIRSPAAADLVTSSIPQADAGSAFALAADGSRLAIGSEQGVVEERSVGDANARTTSERAAVAEGEAVFGKDKLMRLSALAYSPDGRFLVVGAGAAGTAGGESGYCDRDQLCGGVALLARNDAGSLQRVAFEVRDGADTPVASSREAVTHVAFSRDGSHFAAVSLRRVKIAPGESDVETVLEVWQLAEALKQRSVGRPMHRWTLDTGISQLAAAEDPSEFVAVTRDKSVLSFGTGRTPRMSRADRLRQCPAAPSIAAAGNREVRAEPARLCVFESARESILMTLDAPTVIEAALRGNGNVLVTTSVAADGGIDVAVRDLAAGKTTAVVRHVREGQALERCAAAGTPVEPLACAGLDKWVQVSADGAVIAVRSKEGGPIDVHRAMAPRNRPEWLTQRAETIVFSANDEVFGVLVPTDRAAERAVTYRVHNAATGRLDRDVTLTVDDDAPQLLMIDATGERFVTQGASGARVLRVDGSRVLPEFGPVPTVDPYPGAAAFGVIRRNSEGRVVDCALHRIDAPLTPVWKLHGELNACLFSGDGRIALVETTRDGKRFVQLHDTSMTGSPAATAGEGLPLESEDSQYFLSGTTAKYMLVATPISGHAGESRVQLYAWRNGTLVSIASYAGPSPASNAGLDAFAVDENGRALFVTEGSDRLVSRRLDRANDAVPLRAEQGSLITIAPDARTALVVHEGNAKVYNLGTFAPLVDLPFTVRGSRYSVAGSHVVATTAHGSHLLPLRVDRIEDLLASGEGALELTLRERCKFGSDSDACSRARANGLP